MEFWSYFFIYAGVLTYLTWGVIVAFEVVLVMAGSEFAKKWVKNRYTLKYFMFEIYLFFPLVLWFYLFLEVLPYLLGKSESIAKFDIAGAVYEVFSEELEDVDEDNLR